MEHMNTEQMPEGMDYTMPELEVTARAIEPKKNLLGFASVKIGGITVHDFKVLANKDGELFVGMPSKPDSTSRTGYRNTVYVDKEYMPEFTAAVVDGYRDAVEKLQARAAAVTDKPRMADQMAEAEKQAAEHNAGKPPKAKGGKAKEAEI